MLIQHLIYILWFFALGACVGSFLNVVVWRLPRGESIVSPPSRCPYCEHRLAWYDNVPIFGWLGLRGRCRYCHNPISAEYPTIEFITAALFVLYYVSFFIYHEGPCWMETARAPDRGVMDVFSRPQTIMQHWPLYVLTIATVACLLAGSLIAARHYFVPMSIPILLTAMGLLFHTITDRPREPGSLNLRNPVAAAMALGAGVGLVLSNLLLWKGMLKRSFAEGWPALEIDKEQPQQQEEAPGWAGKLISGIVEAYRRPLTAEQDNTMKDYLARAEDRERQLQEQFDKEARETQPPFKEFTRADLRREMQREILFLLPPMLLGLLCASIAMLLQRSGNSAWASVLQNNVLSGFCGSLMGALVGAFSIWLIRILGTLVFGREAMGMGDVHLMFGIGAIIGSAGAIIVFFVAPFVGIAFALRKLIFQAGRELPYVPSLAVAAGLVMLFYCRFIEALAPSTEGLLLVIHRSLGM